MVNVGPIHQWNSARRLLIKPPVPWTTDTRSAHAASPEFVRDVTSGLMLRPRHIPGQHLFDIQGSALFERAIESPEYFLARTELRLFNHHAAEMARRIGPCAEIMEIGAGQMRVVRRLIEEADQLLRYMPLDHCAQHLLACASGLQHDYPHLDIQPAAIDYLRTTDWPATPLQANRRIALVGAAAMASLSPNTLTTLLVSLKRALLGGAIIATVDQLNDPVIQRLAYQDSSGLMAAFNLNLLQRIRRELAPNLDVSAFRHAVQYDTQMQFAELKLTSMTQQRIDIQTADQEFKIEVQPGEEIFTMRAHQRSVSQLHRLAADAGYTAGPVWLDTSRQVAVCWLNAPQFDSPS